MHKNSIQPVFSIVTLLIAAFVFAFSSCRNSHPKNTNDEFLSNKLSLCSPEIATGFRVLESKDVKLIEISNPRDTASLVEKFYLVGEAQKDKTFVDGKTLVVPIKSMVCLSATHLSFLDALGKIETLIGVSSADYVVSPEFRNRVEDGKIKEIGVGDHFKLEELINLSPDIVMVSPQKGQSFEPLINAGLVIMPNGDFLEQHPLGRAEWIKFVGVLTGKEKEAIQIFDSIKSEYFRLKKLTENISQKPTVISGKQYGGFWNLPGGKSYVAQFFKDAGANYLWADDQGSGGIMLDFEAVYDKGLNADFWRFLVYSNADFTYEMLANEDKRYTGFKAFTDKKIMICNTLEKPYFQKGLLEPQVILADYIKIFHPELLPDHKNVYYQLMK